MSTTEAEARAEAALRDYDYARISRVTVDPHRLAEALRALLAASRREPSEPDCEWEYGYELIESDTRDVLDRGWRYATAEEARAEGERRAAEESETSPEMPRVDFYTVRRCAAGPWEVVPDGE